MKFFALLVVASLSLSAMANTPKELDIDVNFATESTVIHQQYRDQVQRLAQYLKKNPETRIEIKGYADETGDAAFNQDLSKRRAEAIRKMLVEDYDIAPDTVSAAGIGETDKVSPHEGTEGKYRNRRVEARIL